MNRTIRVTSNKENILREHLYTLGRSKEREIENKLKKSISIFSELFFAPIKDEMLGRFYPDGRYIVLNESLFENNVGNSIVENIFLHEMAHGLDFAINGTLSGHSVKFREYCEFLGVESGFDKAKVKTTLQQQKKAESKINKLIALTSSPFENEAMIALAKAQKLMLENKELAKKDEKEEKLYISELYESRKISFHITKLCNFIAKATGVFIVKCKENDSSILRVYGDFEQVEFSLYLFDYILDNINKEVKELRKEGKHITKDSFVMGAIPEMEAKLFNADKETSNALTLVQQENKAKVKRLVFKKGLRTIKYGSRTLSEESYRQGTRFAKGLDLPLKIKQKKLTQ